MGKVGIGIASLIIGLLAGALGGALLAGGAAAGAGAATGLSAGICSTVQAAQDLELLTAEQVDQVLNKAAQNLSGKDALPADEKVVGSADACAQVMEKFGQQ